MVVDTSIFIEYIRAKDKSKTTLGSIPDNPKLRTTSVSLYELKMGATSEEKGENIERLLTGLDVLPFDKDAAEEASKVYNQLNKSNQLIEYPDIFIAAICIRTPFRCLS